MQPRSVTQQFNASTASLGGYRASRNGSGNDRAARAYLAVPGGPGARARGRNCPEAGLHGRERGQRRAASLSNRPRSVPGILRQRDSLAGEGQCQSRVDNRTGRALQGARRRERSEPAGLRQCRRRRRAGGRRRRGGQGSRCDCPDQPGLHERGIADHGPHRYVVGDAGCLRPGKCRNADGDRPADRSDLR